MGYSRELLVLEKIRAICQQDPRYQYRMSKNRARDFYDIHELTVHGTESSFRKSAGIIQKVFEAKNVPLYLLDALWNNAFIDEQRRGFDEVKDTVSGPVYDFDLYVEHLRFLVKEIYPSGLPQPPSDPS
ncbi:MAG: nucleotidyl transferase AbiEii/AbiGii toxin family protein [Lentisphaerota bacterium]